MIFVGIKMLRILRTPESTAGYREVSFSSGSEQCAWMDRMRTHRDKESPKLYTSKNRRAC